MTGHLIMIIMADTEITTVMATVGVIMTATIGIGVITAQLELPKVIL